MTTKRQAVADAITEEIVNGALLPDSRLPTERDLADKHAASRDVVRLALHDLADAGRIRAVQGSGWYVRRFEPLRYPLHTIDADRAKAVADVWDTWLAREGKTGGNELTVRAAAEPPPEVRRKLALGPGDLAVERRRVRLVNREPWMLSTGWWPRWLSAGTDIERPENVSPLQLAIDLGHGQARSENEIGARMPTTDEAAVLGTGRGVPVMTMLTTGWDSGGWPMRCTADVFPAHRFLLYVEHEHGAQGGNE